jgi:hypothetical protein
MNRSDVGPVSRTAMPRQTAAEVLDAYFLETRAKLLEIAATLDRVDRAGGVANEPRMQFIEGALRILQSAAAPNRAEQIQRLYSKE